MHRLPGFLSFNKLMLATTLLLACFIAIGQTAEIVLADPMSPDQVKAVNQYANWVANACSAATNTSAPDNVTINQQAAQQIARQSGVNVGYALYDSSGKLLANYNDTFENYGASITKSMLLVAYLKQVGSGTLSSDAKTELTNMIENSDNASADWVYNHLNSGNTAVNNVAQDAGMKGFKLSTSDPVYVLGQSQITANDFAKFFSKIDTMFPAQQKDFALNLLSNITPQAGLLQAGLPGTVYSKEGWKAEPDSTNPFGQEGAPYVVNQAGQFSGGDTTYGIAVTVAGTANESSGETIIKNVASALVSSTGQNGPGPASSDCCPPASGTGDGSVPTSLSGSDNEHKAFNFFIQVGLSPAQSAGVVANLYNESSVNPLVSGDNPNVAAFGIAQWTPGSKFSADKQKNHITGPDGDLLTQLQVLWAEMNGKSSQGFTDIVPGLKKITKPGDAAEYFRDNFERCDLSYSSCSDRASVGVAEFNKLAGSATGGSVNGGSCPVSSSPDCQTVSGTAKILCAAKAYQGIYYEYGGGHQGYKPFKQRCPNPSNPPNNQPHGGPVNGDPAGMSGNPSPCGLDCSSLVSVAVDDAFGQSFMWTVGGKMIGAGSQYWHSVPMSQAQAGDIVTSSGHVEIVDHVQGGTVYTFGAHSTGEKIGPTTFSTSYFTGGAWRWAGPGI